MIRAQSRGMKVSIKPSRHCDIDEYRQQSESDKHWSARRQFIAKHISEYEGKAVEKLLALSMVWVNHVFLGCRYEPQLMHNVLEMAEGISVGELPSYELVPGADTKKRQHSSAGSEQPVKKMFVSRPRFEPVHFVSGGSSSSGIEGTDEKENERRKSKMSDDRQREPGHQTYNGSHDSGPSSSYASSETLGCGFDRQADSQAGQFDGNSATGRSGAWENRRRGLGFGQPDRPSSSKAVTKVHNGPGSGLLPTPSLPTPIFTRATEEKQRLISRVSSAIAVTLRDPTFTGGPETPIYNFILSRSIQACKTNPEYIYVNLKDIPPSDLPKNRKVLSEGYACELRCQGVYLATGYSGSKNGARDRASEQAVKLLMKTVEVRIMQRQYKRKNVNDMVVCQVNNPNPILPPPLRNPEDRVPPSTKGQYEPDRSKHWTQFVLMENAHDAICMLNNSAAFNRMKVNYTFNPVPNSNLWSCSVYLQDELLAQAKGTKKSSKHSAAEEAVRILRMHQAEHQQQQQQQQHVLGGNHSSEQSGGHFGQHGGKKSLSQLVILENSDNAICIINDTAQFNKVLADYKFTVLPDHNWKCEVYLDGQFVSGGVGPKKIVKHIAAEEAIATLRRTQAVVKSNLRKDGHADAISRNQIIAQSGEESTRQEIKEDNIGNQLLRKMGWRGGGLGREGEGIAVPIKVKEQFTREGLGMAMDRHGNQLTKSDIEDIIRNYACSERQDDLRFANELNNEERKQIHQVSQRYGLRSKSYGQGRQRFLVVSRRVQKDQLIGQLLQEGQVGRYELIKPQALQ